MLGNKVWMLLVVTVVSFSLISEIFAQEILVEFDKSEYETGGTLTLSGIISEFSMPIVAVSVYDPNGKILSANNLELDEAGYFSKTISLDSPFYDISGNYKIKIDYQKISQEEIFVINGDKIIPEPILDDDISPEIILLTTDKEVYSDGDTVKISGLVSSLESPTVLIGLYDPFGTPAGFYFGTIDENLEFSTSFLIKAGVNFKLDGIYSIKAHYSDQEITTNFEFYDQTPEPIDQTPEPIDQTPEPPQENNEKKNSNQDNNSIIQNTSKEQPKKKENNSLIKETKNNTEKKSKTESKTKSDNLSVEDIELGKLLNQINLDCDRSKYADTISYYDGMGPALYRLCKFDSSIDIFNEALLKDPGNVEILTNKGSALGKLGYYDAAILHYDRALSINPNFFPAINNKANIFANMGNYEEAMTLYSEVLGKNPNYVTARQNLQLVLSEIPQEDTSTLKPKTTMTISESMPQKTLTINKPVIGSKEKPQDIFEQLGSVFSSLGSLLGISD